MSRRWCWKPYADGERGGCDSDNGDGGGWAEAEGEKGPSCASWASKGFWRSAWFVRLALGVSWSTPGEDGQSLSMGLCLSTLVSRDEEDRDAKEVRLLGVGVGSADDGGEGSAGVVDDDGEDGERDGAWIWVLIIVVYVIRSDAMPLLPSGGWGG